MTDNCPKCGRFTRLCATDKVVARRPDGTKCMSRFTHRRCDRCGYRTTPTTATLAYWQAEAQAGRAVLVEQSGH